MCVGVCVCVERDRGREKEREICPSVCILLVC